MCVPLDFDPSTLRPGQRVRGRIAFIEGTHVGRLAHRQDDRFAKGWVVEGEAGTWFIPDENWKRAAVCEDEPPLPTGGDGA